MDNRNAIEVLMYDTFKKMSLDKSLFKPTGLIYDFINQPIRVKRLITLLVVLDQGDHTVTAEAKFFMVNLFSTYNAIIG